MLFGGITTIVFGNALMSLSLMLDDTTVYRAIKSYRFCPGLVDKGQLRQINLRLIVRWSPDFGQEVKLGLLLRRTDRRDEQTKAVFGRVQGEGGS